MNILKQFSVILVILGIGEFISSLINNFLPGSIIGMMILFICLNFKIIKLEQIKDISDFLLDNLAFFFVPVGVSLINSLDLIKENLFLLISVNVVSTFLVMFVTGMVVEKTIKEKK